MCNNNIIIIISGDKPLNIKWMTNKGHVKGGLIKFFVPFSAAEVLQRSCAFSVSGIVQMEQRVLWAPSMGSSDQHLQADWDLYSTPQQHHPIPKEKMTWAVSKKVCETMEELCEE